MAGSGSNELFAMRQLRVANRRNGSRTASPPHGNRGGSTPESRHAKSRQIGVGLQLGSEVVIRLVRSQRTGLGTGVSD